MKTALVTGGSSGIGRAWVEKLSACGYQVYTMSRPSPHYEECIAAWRGRSITPFIGSITLDHDLQPIVDALAKQTAGLDLLINNAGIYLTEDSGLPSIETLEASLQTNLIAQYRVTLTMLPFLKQADKPIILNISSGAASLTQVHAPGPLAYRVGKAALNMLSRSLAFELKQEGIVVHAVDPGYVRTRLNPDGIASPEEAVDRMWHLLTRDDPNQSGNFWLADRRLPW